MLRRADGRLSRLSIALLLAIGALAYRPLVSTAFELPSGAQFEGWLFRPSQLPAPLVIALAVWLLLRRRRQLLAVPARSAPLITVLGIVLGGSLFVWAQLTRTADLLLPALSATLLAFAAAARGRAGCRAVALPALVLPFGAQLPLPLLDEIVWRLQLRTTSAAAWLIEGLGREIVHGGVTLRTAGHSFQVIDTCSGLNGIAILSLVALIVRELFASASARVWLLLPLAPALGFALNAVRIAYVATRPDPETLAGMQGDHTPQGLAVLIAGTAILYAVGWALARSGEVASPRSGKPSEAGPVSGTVWGLAAGGLAIQAAVSASLPPFDLTDAAILKPTIELPERAAGWESERLIGDLMFFGTGGQLIHRRYQPVAEGQRAAEQAVEIFVGFETSGSPERNLLLSSKLAWPGPDWDIVHSSGTTLWTLQRDAELTIASRRPGTEHAVVYSWRPGDLGLWRESWRSLLALDSTPFRRGRARRVVRLMAFAPHDGALVLERARQRLDAFLAVFRAELAAF
jgi:exosortase/archaeosortase family protein